MKALKTGAKKHRLTLVTLVGAAGLLAMLLWVSGVWAQPPIPHAVDPEGEDCLACHQFGVAGAPIVPWDHLGRINEECQICHHVSGALASEITHPVLGREDCLSCHLEGVGNTPGLKGNHPFYTNDDCDLCHLPSAAALEPTPIPTVEPLPTPEEGPSDTGAGSCVACHQLIFADEEHMLFTGQPVGDAGTGEVLYAQLCATCHGEEGETPVGDEDSVIGAEEYWSTHDDAAILQDIGAGSHGEMTAFARDYDGPLSWEEILDVAAFVRSWGPVALPSEIEMPGAVTYANSIGPLLTERCGTCHGSSAGLAVTDYDSLMAGSNTGPVIVTGDPDGSTIVVILRDGHFAVLSEEELDLLIEWIAEGAPE
jgi:mono/diheme cytochrome c family protein